MHKNNEPQLVQKKIWRAIKMVACKYKAIYLFFITICGEQG